MDKPIMIAVLAGMGWLAGLACRTVLARIPRGVDCPRYWCECGVAALWAAAGLLSGCAMSPQRWLPTMLVLAVFAVPLVICDLRASRLPNALTLPAYPVLGLTAVLAEPQAWQRILAAAAMIGGAHLLMRLCAPGSLGGGDVKLAGALGLLLGARGWPAVILFAPLAALVTTALGLMRRRRSGIPHGPGLLTAGWLLVVI